MGLKTRSLWLALLIVLLIAVPVIAQADDDAPVDDPVSTSAAELQEAIDALTHQDEEETASTPQGLSILFLLAGLAGIGGVGMAMIGRDRFRNGGQSPSAG
ncbi:MAG: hypothetical protein EA396_11775 [Anaerolineaceae bacterium]|nr:MAG: hypothetical protein EA396_11775 [Anaerolineaceae bacterium]